MFIVKPLNLRYVTELRFLTRETRDVIQFAYTGVSAVSWK